MALYPKTVSPKIVSLAFDCQAWRGVPCKSPSGKQSPLHVARVQLLADDEKRSKS